MYQSYRDYFAGTDDVHAHFFEITNSPYPSMFYSESKTFGSGEHKIHIVDQFNGKRPALFNHDFCTTEDGINLMFWCSIALDSNVVSLLHEYVTNPEDMEEDQKDATEKFLVHLCETNCDFSPMFYVVESFFKSSQDDFNANVPNALESILTLHSMDEEEFIKTRKIKLKKDAVANYLQLYQSDNYYRCAQQWAKSITADIARTSMLEKVNITYACLLKMVLIKFMDNKGIYKKSEQFEKFMMDELGLRLARESSLALYYFANLAGKFINTQANMSLDNAIHDLKATAWDLYLLKLPEQLLTPNHLPEIAASYVATCESKLQEVGNLFDIQSIACRTDDDGVGIPMLEFDMTTISEKVGDKAVEKLIKRNEEISFERISKEPIRSATSSKLRLIINDLESQLSYLCRK